MYCSLGLWSLLSRQPESKRQLGIQLRKNVTTQRNTKRCEYRTYEEDEAEADTQGKMFRLHFARELRTMLVISWNSSTQKVPAVSRRPFINQ